MYTFSLVGEAAIDDQICKKILLHGHNRARQILVA